jgi:hypothetical protein
MTSIDRNGMRIHFPLTPVNKGMKKGRGSANLPRPCATDAAQLCAALLAYREEPPVLLCEGFAR